MKYRILIYSMTYYRDYGMSYVLSKLLEEIGYESYVVSTENYLSRDTKLTNPDAIFFMTANRTKTIIEHYPNAKLFFCSAEGHQEAFLDEEYFIKNHNLSENFVNFFFWGKNSLYRFRNILKKADLSNDIKTKLLKKCLIVGHPRLDTIKFAKKKEKTKKFKIGFIGCGHYLSRIDELRLSTEVLDREFNNFDPTIKHMLYSANQLKVYVKIIKKLGFEKYEYSYRPYPQESRKAIKASRLYKEKKLFVSNELDFGSWVSKQDLIIGDLTEAFTYIYAAKKPYVCTARVIGKPVLEDLNWLDPTIRKIKKNLYASMPTNIDLLVKKIKSKNISVSYTPNVRNQLYNVFNFKNDSVLKKISLSIDKGLKNKKKNLGVPFFFIKILRNILSKNDNDSYSKISISKKSINQELKSVIESLTKN